MGGRLWTPEEDDLVRALPPREAARRTGRSLKAVYDRRHVFDLAPAGRWTPAEDDLVRTLPAKEAARRTGRTLQAVYERRQALGILRRHAGRRRPP
jgi:hypothetical protein